MELGILREGSLYPSESTNSPCQEQGMSGNGLLHACRTTNATSPWSQGYKERDYYMLVSLPMRQTHGAMYIGDNIGTCQSVYQCDKSMELGIFGNGLLHASQSINATSPWSQVYLERNYYMLVSLSMQQVHGVKDIRKDYYMLVILPMRQEHGARDIRIGIITCYSVCQFDRSFILDCFTMQTESLQ